MRTAALALLLFGFGWIPSAGAADPDNPLILVAAPELHDPLYGASVLVVTPLGGDEHVGFIVNRPTSFNLGKAVPLYLGGPVEPELIFALVERENSPGTNSILVAPGLYAAYDGAVVNGIIKSDPQHARVMAELVMRNPEGLWEELVHRSQRIRNTI